MTTADSIGAGVYSVPGEQDAASSFDIVRSSDPDRGWNAARNLLKSLNHLDLVESKESTARLLGVMTGEVDERSRQILVDHAGGRMTTQQALSAFAGAAGLGERESIQVMLRDYASVAHMEFHPSDRCNLACTGCTYGHDIVEEKPDPVSFPWDELPRLQDLKPRSIVIVGGGEPTLYMSQGHRFAEMVTELRRLLPHTKLSMITNGTHVPDGRWTDELAWVRLSVDAADDHTYRLVRGRPMLERVMKGFSRYLDSSIAQVGVSFLFSKFNIAEALPFARKTYDFVNARRDGSLARVNVQYRPLRIDGDLASARLDFAVSREEILQVAEACEREAHDDPSFGRFLREQTNIWALGGGNVHPAHEFDRCRYSQIFTIVRANGDLRPCFIRVREPEFLVGNLIRDPLESISLRRMHLALVEDTGCKPANCRQCHVNNVLARGTKNLLQPSNSPDVRADPMF